MCYILAHDRDKQGCIALKTQIGEELSELDETLNSICPRKEIEIVTISRPTAYGEYAPYRFVDTEEDLIEAVKAM